jgi:CrcB protein
MGAWIAVAVGGALGSIARFWMTTFIAGLTGPKFPWGTLLINILGSLLIGLVAGFTIQHARGAAMNTDLRIFLMTGICGGFTTFSAFSLQTAGLLQAGAYLPALGYAVGSVVLCVVATFAGLILGEL